MSWVMHKDKVNRAQSQYLYRYLYEVNVHKPPESAIEAAENMMSLAQDFPRNTVIVTIQIIKHIVVAGCLRINESPLNRPSTRPFLRATDRRVKGSPTWLTPSADSNWRSVSPCLFYYSAWYLLVFTYSIWRRYQTEVLQSPKQR